MAKKYEKYKINVQYLNGDTEDINMAGINTNDYTRMLKVYHRIKNTYAEKVKVINFVGVGQDGSMSIMFKKEIKQQGREELTKDISDIMNNISEQLQLIKDKYFHSSNMIGALNKKEDIKLHELEDIMKDEFKTEQNKDLEILRVGKEIGNLRLERRWHKDQVFLINKLSNNKIHTDEINFTHLSNIFRVKHVKPEMKQLNNKVAEELKLYKEEPIKDKAKQIDKLKKTYERIVVDEVENKLIAYNKAKVI
jgi:hypothetical protein